MKKINHLLATVVIMICAIGLSSCVDKNDSKFSFQGSDFATIVSIGDKYAYFDVPLANEGSVTLYGEYKGRFDPTEYPAGSYVLLTYIIESGLDESLPMPVDIVSVTPVKSLGLTQASTSECENALTTGSYTLGQPSVQGYYVQMMVNVNKAENRIWTCYWDTEASDSKVAHIYLTTKAVEPDKDTQYQFIRVNINDILAKGTFRQICLHGNTQNGTDSKYYLEIPEK